MRFPESAALATMRPAATATYEPRPVAYGPVEPMPYVSRGEICPTCGSARFWTQFTFWHFLAAVVFFPFGLFALLAPVKICENGHRYGLGRWLVGAIKVLVVLGAAIAITLVTLLLTSVHDLAKYL